MKNLEHLSKIGPNPVQEVTIASPEKPETIYSWQVQFEQYLLLSGRKGTGERYGRALETFRARFPKKVYPHEWFRSEINKYVVDRLEEGAAVSTVRLELSAIRALWDFMEKMDATDVLFNPAANIKIPRQYLSKGKKSAPAIEEQCDHVQDQCEAEMSVPTDRWEWVYGR
jgi:site-specific recombinase XerC